ncbi:Uncharacterised protein [Mycobacteroides abscessus]|nr:Uncharacterised protein [Mycobacteroides abscessus]
MLPAAVPTQRTTTHRDWRIPSQARLPAAIPGRRGADRPDRRHVLFPPSASPPIRPARHPPDAPPTALPRRPRHCCGTRYPRSVTPEPGADTTFPPAGAARPPIRYAPKAIRRRVPPDAHPTRPTCPAHFDHDVAAMPPWRSSAARSAAAAPCRSRHAPRPSADAVESADRPGTGDDPRDLHAPRTNLRARRAPRAKSPQPRGDCAPEIG